MALKVARGQVTIIDQNDAVSLQAYIGSNQPLTQLYNRDSLVSTPSWASSPYLILTPSLFVSGNTADQITITGNASTLVCGVKSGSAKWYKNGVAVTSGSDNCTIGAAAAAYALTIKANHMSIDTPQVRYAFQATYIDANGLEIPFRAEIQFTQHISAGATICAIAYAPDGVVFRNDEVASLRAHCDLWRGASIDNTNVSYYWGIIDSGVFAPTTLKTAASSGATSLTVNSTDNMEAGSKIQVGSATYTISSLNKSTGVVTLTSGLSAAAVINSQVSSPYYNENLGAGWSYLTSTNPCGVTAGWTTNEITVSADAVLNFETFKCAIKDTDTTPGNSSANMVVCDLISYSDMSDPITVDLVSQRGFIIKNDSNDVDVKAELYRAGIEIDSAGTNYTYEWKLWNNAGTAVVKTGVAIGKFDLQTRNSSGSIITETLNGIYGFRDGYKTFTIDTTGSVELGRGDQSIKYNALTGKIEFGSAISMQWAGATYIDANGIFTGTLSATTIQGITINASQITAGKISSSLIDTASLKSELITASNIEALTLNVVRGTIGGWSIDADSIYRGTKNNTANGYTSASGYVTMGSNGIRGYKWRLESTGAGAVAGGNISWDAAGNVTFGQSVTVQWTTLVNNIQGQIDNTVTPRLTQITATGIYTGTLTAAQVNAVAINASSITTGTLAAARIAAGSITVDKLDVTTLKANLITATNINGLTLTFDKGTIGGWKINSSSITSSSGNISLDNANMRIAVFGSGASSTSGSRVMLHYTSASNYGFQVLDASNAVLVNLGYTNTIAGWNITQTYIYKNSVYLGADGSLYNGTKWKLNNDGSGQIANGNISWDAAGAVTFSSAVSLNWTNGINGLTTALGGSTYPKMTYISSAGIYTGTLTATQVNAVAINASSIATGTLSAARIAAGSITVDKLDVASLKADLITAANINGLSLTFIQGKIGGWTIGSDHILAGTINTIGSKPIQIRSAASGSSWWYTGQYKPYGVSMLWRYSSGGGHIVFGDIAATASSIKTGFLGLQMMDSSSNEYFCLAANTTSSSTDVYNRIAGWGFDNQQLWKNNVYLSSDGSIVNGTKWKLNNDGSGQIANGNITWNASGVVTFSASVALNWSSGNVDGIINALGGSSYPKLTQITSTGVYTGTVNANQVLVNSTLTVGGTSSSSSYNGVISVCNTSNVAVVTLDRTGITAISGKIGGWTMTSNALYSGSIYLDSNGYIYNGSYWKLNSDGSGLLASNNISWDAAGAITLKNAIIQDVTIKGTIRAPFVRVDGSISVSLVGGTAVVNRPDSEKYDNMVVIAGTDSAGWNLQSPALPWNYEQSGRRLTLVHYRYGSEYCYGTATFTAPAGYYFYENGLTASKLNMSREVVELMGYGTATAFYGWIVLNRRDIGTTSRYGGYTQYLAMGTVTTTTSSCSIKYKTYDGTTITATRTGTGQYTVYLPWSLGADKYMVMLSGVWYDGPIYATIKSQSSSYFYVQTGDDNTANNGSFSFIVVSTADFK